MSKTFLNLPSRRLTKRKTCHPKKGIFETLKNIRSGSKFSRLFRCLFEKRKIKTILGGNLILLVLTSSFFSPRASAFNMISDNETKTLSLKTIELTTKTSFRFPLDEVKITQGFSLFHQAIDLDGSKGDLTYPIAEGVVEAVFFKRFGLGNHIIINHGCGLRSIYGHLSKIEVSVGDKVDINKAIGEVGSSGNSSGDHLHLEVLEENRHLNPLTILHLRQAN